MLEKEEAGAQGQNAVVVTTLMWRQAGAVERRRRRVLGTVGGCLALVLAPGQRYAPDQLEAAVVEVVLYGARAGLPGAWLWRLGAAASPSNRGVPT